MDLQAFLQETHKPLDTMNSDLKKYIPDQTNQEPSIEFVRSAEQEAKEEVKALDQILSYDKDEITIFRPNLMTEDNQSID